VWRGRVNAILRTVTGYELARPRSRRPAQPPKRRRNQKYALRSDYDEAAKETITFVRPRTMTSSEKLFGLISAVRHVVKHDISGDIVECGVWRGGSMQAVALTLMECGVQDRDLYLYDTFDAIPRPSERDTDIYGRSALEDWQRYREQGLDAVAHNFHSLPFAEVRAALLATGYPSERVHFVKGDVRDTLPAQAPDEIALLRLDTDYYDSTWHELVHLEPRVCDGGAILVDDYGHFSGARDAVDEYYAKAEQSVLLHRIDYTARLVLARR
jgi:O-methyltransferase